MHFRLFNSGTLSKRKQLAMHRVCVSLRDMCQHIRHMHKLFPVDDTFQVKMYQPMSNRILHGLELMCRMSFIMCNVYDSNNLSILHIPKLLITKLLRGTMSCWIPSHHFRRKVPEMFIIHLLELQSEWLLFGVYGTLFPAFWQMCWALSEIL